MSTVGVYGPIAAGEADGVLFQVIGSGRANDADYFRMVDAIVTMKRSGVVKGGTIIVGESRFPTLASQSQRRYLIDKIAPYKKDPMNCIVLSDSALLRTTVNALSAALKLADFRVQMHSFAARDIERGLQWLDHYFAFDHAVVIKTMIEAATAVGCAEVAQALSEGQTVAPT